jgi:hypothetical protein
VKGRERVSGNSLGSPSREPDLLVVTDVLGPDTSVNSCRTYRRIRWIAPVVRELACRSTRPGTLPRESGLRFTRLGPVKGID